MKGVHACGGGGAVDLWVDLGWTESGQRVDREEDDVQRFHCESTCRWARLCGAYDEVKQRPAQVESATTSRTYRSPAAMVSEVGGRELGV